MRFLVTAALLLGAGCAAPPRPDPVSEQATLAFTHVHVVDVESGRIAPDQTVLVVGRHITTVGRSADVAVPPDARVVESTGKYLIPGLWDMHTHVTKFGSPALSLMVAQGVTGLRDMGAERLSEARALRDSITAGLLLGPRMKIAGPVVENPRWLAFAKSVGERAGTPWTLYERFGPATADEATSWVDSVAALGVDHIKVRNWPSPEVGGALVRRAREHGLPVVGHANEPFPRGGIATLEHAVWPPTKGAPAARQALWQQLAASGVAWVPTLVTWPIRLNPVDTLLARVEDGRMAGLQYIPRPARDDWRNQLLGMAQEAPFDWAEAYHGALRDLHEMRAAGVPILAGTDVGAVLLIPGTSLHDELELLVAGAGMSPLEALQAATSTPARVLAVLDSLGTVRVGNVADLVLLDGDPMQDIRNTRRISGVVLNGQYLDRRSLDELLAAVEQHAGGN